MASMTGGQQMGRGSSTSLYKKAGLMPSPMEDIEEILITEEQLKAKVKELGEMITRDYEGKDLVLIGVLKGAIMFMSGLSRAIDLPLSIDFLAVSSYGSSTKSSGIVKIIKDHDIDIEGKDVLIVEDIIDSGLTLAYLRETLLGRKPRSLKICTILDKPERREADVKVDYCGFKIPDKFVVGYGLDYAEKYRNLPFIGVLKPELYK
uniref:Hypoxanthine-guanine phosphoribosyltransferase n=1 Tax=Caldanaerobacter subterraneus subsp. tengcongensis TaxID=119072 RepID=UPI000045089E|nr:Chain A, Hypoxanthine-guanine phosphoribosyltransferase [Caldanaerobacter subterraneus subsp. tengcongensis]1R3U_B Chain B, Hypoxanthine-guanine phosphoribosyltransferase [Caldanaerobacter subterraneus subsp. tengcongensis]1YFZ_A Chain A, Hypoxanthine-guanine phosphoribosyltransferase [Caldanaerobacter subterraneus subsp. tengcongensis MB4]1YFZ_B Chain B, Hypoxanthine-guanine phosphoribosyltransferase [Caldanaerobacter subterraneus subsp. tengcongensis MB4]